jgi:hypothetical protein
MLVFGMWVKKVLSRCLTALTPITRHSHSHRASKAIAGMISKTPMFATALLFSAKEKQDERNKGLCVSIVEHHV